MAKKFGICCNYDGDCEKCNSKEVQEVDAQNFVCEDCGAPLREYQKPKTFMQKNGTKVYVGSALIVVIAIVLGIILKCSGGSEMERPIQEPPVQVDPNGEPGIDTLRVDTATAVEPVVVEPVEDPKEKVIEPQPEPLPTPAPTKPKTATSGNGKLSLSYGTYRGDIKRGYPEGMGRLTYSTTRVINKYDSKGRKANPGDYVEGEFVRGFFINGKHFNADGDIIETLMVGVPASTSYEEK